MSNRHQSPEPRRLLGPVVRSWAVFLLGIAAFQTFAVATPRIWGYTSVATAHLTAWAMRALGVEAHASGALLSSSWFSLEIIWECTATFPIVLFVAAVIAYPCTWKSKAIGVLAGVPLLIAVNVVRLVTLCYIGRSYPELFETAHMLVWQSLFIFVVALAWIIWGVVFVNWYERKNP